MIRIDTRNNTLYIDKEKIDRDKIDFRDDHEVRGAMIAELDVEINDEMTKARVLIQEIQWTFG